MYLGGSVIGARGQPPPAARGETQTVPRTHQQQHTQTALGGMAPVGAPGPPVAVTGASGFIGSHVVRELLSRGYTVHACVRDLSRSEKTDFLLALAPTPGSLVLFEADLTQAGNGAYDEAFAGTQCVFHVAADLGTDATYGTVTPQSQYSSIVEATSGILASVERAGTVSRVVYTSSTAAVMGPAPNWADGYEFTEDDWAGAGGVELLKDKWTSGPETWGSNSRSREQWGPVGTDNWTIERNAYAKAKVDAELMAYRWGGDTNIDVVSCNPCHVLGPLLSPTQLGNGVLWQSRIADMLEGRDGHEGRGDGLWNIVDVRNIAQAQRLMAESTIATNGSRYNLVATDTSGELSMLDMRDTLQRLFPAIDVCGSWEPPDSRNRPRAKCMRAIRELGLQTYTATATLKATADSLLAFGLVTPKMRASM
jgi:nucleoside-diphosphate-sugar epimerase